MINVISNNLLRVDEEIGYYAELLKMLEANNSDDLQLVTFISKLKTAVNEVQEAIHQAKGSNYTNLANELEKIRDNSFIAFRDNVKSGTYRNKENWAYNASKIERIIRSHGWSLQNKGARVQTALMESLAKELDKPENQSIIKELALEDWYAEMNQTNKEYLDVVNNRVTEEIQREKFNNSILYKTLRSAGTNLCKAVSVFYDMSGNEKYTQIANTINTLTEKYMTIARSRKTRNENERAAVSEKE